MKKKNFAFMLLFASSLVLFISCDKESVTPLIPEENQGFSFKEGSGTTAKQVCCLAFKSYLDHPDIPLRHCCIASSNGTCLPCFIVQDPYNENIQKLNALLDKPSNDVAIFFKSVSNYIDLFPYLIQDEYSEYLLLLNSGNYVLIEIAYDSETNTYLYIFENIKDKTRIGLPFTLQNN